MSLSVLTSAARKAARDLYMATAARPRAVGFAVDAMLYDRMVALHFDDDGAIAALERGMFQVKLDGELVLEVVRR